MMLYPVYRTPSKPLPQWQCEVFAMLILPPMTIALIVWMLWCRALATSLERSGGAT